MAKARDSNDAAQPSDKKRRRASTPTSPGVTTDAARVSPSPRAAESATSGQSKAKVRTKAKAATVSETNPEDVQVTKDVKETKTRGKPRRMKSTEAGKTSAEASETSAETSEAEASDTAVKPARSTRGRRTKPKANESVVRDTTQGVYDLDYDKTTDRRAAARRRYARAAAAARGDEKEPPRANRARTSSPTSEPVLHDSSDTDLDEEPLLAATDFSIAEESDFEQPEDMPRGVHTEPAPALEDDPIEIIDQPATSVPEDGPASSDETAEQSTTPTPLHETESREFELDPDVSDEDEVSPESDASSTDDAHAQASADVASSAETDELANVTDEASSVEEQAPAEEAEETPAEEADAVVDEPEVDEPEKESIADEAPPVIDDRTVEDAPEVGSSEDATETASTLDRESIPTTDATTAKSKARKPRKPRAKKAPKRFDEELVEQLARDQATGVADADDSVAATTIEAVEHAPPSVPPVESEASEELPIQANSTETSVGEATADHGPVADPPIDKSSRRMLSIAAAAAIATALFVAGIMATRSNPDVPGTTLPSTSHGPTVTTDATSPPPSETAPPGTTVAVRLSGNESRQSALFTLPRGQTRVTYSSTDGSLTIRLLKQSSTGTGTGDAFACSNECERTDSVSVDAGTYYLEVDSRDSEWQVQISY